MPILNAFRDRCENETQDLDTYLKTIRERTLDDYVDMVDLQNQAENALIGDKEKEARKDIDRKVREYRHNLEKEYKRNNGISHFSDYPLSSLLAGINKQMWGNKPKGPRE